MSCVIMDSVRVKDQCQQVMDNIQYERVACQADIIKELVGTRPLWSFSRYTYQTAFEYLENQDPYEWPSRIQSRYNAAKRKYYQTLDECERLISLANCSPFITVTDDHIYIFTDN